MEPQVVGIGESQEGNGQNNPKGALLKGTKALHHGDVLSKGFKSRLNLRPLWDKGENRWMTKVIEKKIGRDRCLEFSGKESADLFFQEPYSVSLTKSMTPAPARMAANWKRALKDLTSLCN